MSMARMTAEGRRLLASLVREPSGEVDKDFIATLSRLGFVERRDTRWHATKSGKDYLKSQR
ncbi:hypothetical protein [Aureimonas frigidaquae]|uniref:Uncharacterized protein n=1 Tax=Aureimonas frigidaquae TaxID=424757 RepID=A0A0N7KXZ2_9HYPH|nr:hypothetical protein [Aureimonas frigidaquae]BAT28273.1 hypothetical protein [Aureimonas frigidaquae]